MQGADKTVFVTMILQKQLPAVQVVEEQVTRATGDWDIPVVQQRQVTINGPELFKNGVDPVSAGQWQGGGRLGRDAKTGSHLTRAVHPKRWLTPQNLHEGRCQMSRVSEVQNNCERSDECVSAGSAGSSGCRDDRGEFTAEDAHGDRGDVHNPVVDQCQRVN